MWIFKPLTASSHKLFFCLNYQYVPVLSDPRTCVSNMVVTFPLHRSVIFYPKLYHLILYNIYDSNPYPIDITTTCVFFFYVRRG